MKFGPFVEYNMTNIFLENVIEKLVPDTFLKSQKWTYLWINNLKFYTVSICCIPS